MVPVLIQICFTPESNTKSPTITLQSKGTTLKTPEAAENPVAPCVLLSSFSGMLTLVSDGVPWQERVTLKKEASVNALCCPGKRLGMEFFPCLTKRYKLLHSILEDNIHYRLGKGKQKEDNTELWNLLSFMSYHHTNTYRASWGTRRGHSK